MRKNYGNLIPKLLNEGKSERQIVKELGCTRGAVRYWIEKLKINPHPRKYQVNSYPSEQHLKEMYDSDMSIAEIAKNLGINSPTLRCHIKKYCPTIKPIIGCRPKYPVIIPLEMSEQWAYILGLIASDGCISRSKDLIFQQKDYEICSHIRNFLSPTRPVHQNRSYWRLAIRSSELCQLLIDLGIGPRKTKTISLPDISPTYQRHLLRGYFDGDGSVYVTDKGRTLVARIGTSSPAMRDNLACLYNKWDIPHHIRTVKWREKKRRNPDAWCKSDHWYILTYTQASLVLYESLYKDATLFLARKKAIFDQFIHDYANRQYPRLTMPSII